MQAKIILESPQFRDDILISFKDLADKEMQLREWVRVGAAHRYWDSLLMDVFDTIYNDQDLHDIKECREKIGKVFYTEEEALKIADFTIWFDLLTDGIGECKPDSAYLNHPNWPRVWSWAGECYKLMQENDEKYDIDASWDKWHGRV